MKNPQEAINRAMEMVASLPAEYRVVAFAELLRYSLNSRSDMSIDSDLAFNVPKGRPKLLPIDNKSIESLDLHFLAKNGSRDQHVAWAVAELFARGEEANNESIRKIIREYLAIAPPGRQNTNRSLRELTPKYINRTKMGQKYFYTPSPKINEIFEGLDD